MGEIQQSTHPNQWFWIDSNLNIADWITRGKTPNEINEESPWQDGPNFLFSMSPLWCRSRNIPG